MKKIILIMLSLLVFMHAEVLKKESTGEGYGKTRQEAVKNAINEALGKMNGMRQIKLQKFEFNFNGNLNIGYDEEIDFASNGYFNSYDIKNISKTSENEFYAQVVIYKKLYSSTELENRPTLIIVNTIKDTMSAKFEQELLGAILQSNKFKVLDRLDSEIYDKEKSILLQNGNSDELIKLYNNLGADYILILSPKIKQTKNEITSQSYHALIDYRLVEFATKEIKASDSLDIKVSSTSESSRKKATKGMAREIVQNIFDKLGLDFDDENETKEETGLKNNYQLNESGGVDLGF